MTKFKTEQEEKNVGSKKENSYRINDSVKHSRESLSESFEYLIHSQFINSENQNLGYTLSQADTIGTDDDKKRK